MKLVNARTNKFVRSEHVSLLLLVAFGASAGFLTLAVARLISAVITAVFLNGAGFVGVASALSILVGVYLLRAALVFMGELTAGHLGARLKSTLRVKLYDRLLELGPLHFRQQVGEQQSGDISAVILDGVDALEGYITQYLPSLALAVILPVLYLTIVLPLDFLSGIILLLTAPLIPFFMILIGGWAEALTHQRWQTLQRLSGSFLDLIQGLPTLKMLGRSRDRLESVRRISERYRETTMSVLRVTFLSALALELIATISTAVVAVEIGLRLLYGSLDFDGALFILILAPEFYLSLRRLGARFHTGMEGDVAVQSILEILDAPAPNMTDHEPGEKLSNTSVNPVSITFEDVSYTYAGERNALSEISFWIDSGETLIIEGPSGAGKSTLVNLLLGFVRPDRGRVLVGGVDLTGLNPERWRQQIAWVPQRPYLFNTTILENIRIARPDASLQQVQRAAEQAGAHAFIHHLPNGYMTHIGEAGVKLSGGQAQRIAIARAFLKDAPLVILDEPGAHLDLAIEAQIFAALERLLVNRTGIVISHRGALKRPSARVLHLQYGRIESQGTFLSDDGSDPDIERPIPSAPDIDAQGSTLKTHKLPQLPSRFSFNDSSNSDTPLSLTDIWYTIRRLLPLVRPYGRAVGLAVLSGAGTVASGIGLLATGAYLISVAALAPSIAVLQVPIVGVRFFGLARAVFRYLERYLTHDATLRLLAGMRVKFYAVLEPLAPARTSDYFSGDLLSRAVGDVRMLEDFFVRTLAPPLVASLVCLGSLIWVASLSWVFVPVLMFVFLLYTVFVAWVSWVAGQSAQPNLVRRRSELNALLVDGIQGMPDLAVYAGGAHHRKKLLEAVGELARVEKILALASSLRFGLDSLLTDLGVWMILAVGVYAVQEAAFAPVYLAAATLGVYASFEALRPLPLAIESLRRHIIAARRLFEFEDMPPPVTDPPEPQPVPSQAEIRFTQLSFSYLGAPQEESNALKASERQPWQLEGFSLRLSPGKRVAVIGPSGSGKSTLLNLLLRLWEAPAGSILVGGRDIGNYGQDDLRKLFAVVPQRAYLFGATLRQNLLLGDPDAGDESLNHALRLTDLDEFVAALPQGLDTWVGEHGMRLSGGQRRRVAIARAMLVKAPYLLLDEPTAHLDPTLADAVMQALLERPTGQGVLLLTHDLHHLDRFDEILVLDEGRVLERGTLRELIAMDGYFSQLRAQ